MCIKQVKIGDLVKVKDVNNEQGFALGKVISIERDGERDLRVEFSEVVKYRDCVELSQLWVYNIDVSLISFESVLRERAQLKKQLEANQKLFDLLESNLMS